ncbi:MAG: TylF/MycF/NovP-related O-methyltransferase [Planctomycetota bacterium]
MKSKLKAIAKAVLDTPDAKAPHYNPKITLATANELLYFRRLLDLVKGRAGDIVECGVGYGHSLVLWSALAQLEHRKVWGFDSFEGFPEPHEKDKSPRNPQKGQFASDLKGVVKLLESSGLGTEFVRSQVTLVKGFFSETVGKYTGSGIALLHIDADLYQSYLDVLSVLYDKVIPGGVIVFDEYMNTYEHYKFPGAKKAIDEFFIPRAVPILRDEAHGGYYVIKP